VERFRIASPDRFACASAGLRYRITDDAAGICEVIGQEADCGGAVLCIPGTAAIGGRIYRVAGIGWCAFYNHQTVTDVVVAEGVTYVDTAAFHSCPHLSRVILPDSLTAIRYGAFLNSPVTELTLGRSLSEIGEYILSNTTLTGVTYHGTEEEYAARVTVGARNAILEQAPFTYTLAAPPRYFRFPLGDICTGIVSVTLDGAPLTRTGADCRYAVEVQDNRPVAVTLYSADGNAPIGRQLDITVTLDAARGEPLSGRTDFQTASAYDGSMITALAHCRFAAVYDGRVFFSGNPELPDLVFYAGRGTDGAIRPDYVSRLHYFTGTSHARPVAALLPTASYLAVLWGGSTGGVTYRVGQDTGEDLVPRIYPTVQEVAARGCLGAAVNFLGDPVFLSREGLESVSRADLSSERTAEHRSSRIDAALLSHDLSGALAAVWGGYLVLLFPDGDGYLADSRRVSRTASGTAYEWYPISGIGSYTGDVPVWRYAGAYPAGDEPDGGWAVTVGGETLPVELHPDEGSLPFGGTYDAYPAHIGEILSVTAGGVALTCVRETDAAGEPHLFAVTATGERTGGTFSPPTCLASLGGKLLIGCGDGSLCTVNTDRRGRISAERQAAYAGTLSDRQWSRAIPPEWYSICGHRMTAGLVTADDDCGIPNYTKKTVRKTAVADMKLPDGGGFRFQVSINRGNWQDTSLPLSLTRADADFSSLDYAALDFGGALPVIVVLREKTKRWVRKQYRIWSDEYARPFGLYRLSYSYTVGAPARDR